MKTLEQMELEHRRAMEIEKARMEAHVEIAAALNLNPDDIKVSEHAFQADYRVTLPPVADLAGGMTVIEGLNPEALFLVKTSFSAFIPEPRLDAYLDKNNRATATAEAISPYVYEIEQLRQYPTVERNLKAFVVIAGRLCVVYVPVREDKDTWIDFHIRFDRMGNATREYCRIINKSGYFPKSIKWYAPEDQPNHFTLYA